MQHRRENALSVGIRISISIGTSVSPNIRFSIDDTIYTSPNTSTHTQGMQHRRKMHQNPALASLQDAQEQPLQKQPPPTVYV